MVRAPCPLRRRKGHTRTNTAPPVVITGVGPDGIGEGTARAIAAQKPAHLIFASRTLANMEAVAAKLHGEHPGVPIRPVVLDLASQASCRQAAAEIAGLVPHVDVLINNAAVTPKTRRLTPEGLELQFGANHVGHFVFTLRLLPLLEAAARAAAPGATRVVNVSSWGHLISPVRFHDYNLEGKEVPPEEQPKPLPPGLDQKYDGYNAMLAYGQSKTANILFSVGLNIRLRARGIASYALHPGSVDTRIAREQNDEFTVALHKVAEYWGNIDDGSSTSIVAGFDPALDQDSGSVFIASCQFAKAEDYATDPALAEKLWKLSEDLTGEKANSDALKL